MALYDTRPIVGFLKRENEAGNRSLISKNAFPPRETDQNFRKTPSRGGKWGKISEKRLPAAGNEKNSQKNGFPRREMGKIARKTVSRGGKAVKFSGDRFPAAGKGGKISKNAFPPREGCFLSSDVYVAKKGRSTMRGFLPQEGSAAPCRPPPLILPHPCSI